MRAVAKAVPARTCVGCRAAAAKSELVRLVLAEGRVVLAVKGQADGRGSYLHPSVECGQRALQRKAFNRAFRANADTSEVEQWLQGLTERRPVSASTVPQERDRDENPMSTR